MPSSAPTVRAAVWLSEAFKRERGELDAPFAPCICAPCKTCGWRIPRGCLGAGQKTHTFRKRGLPDLDSSSSASASALPRCCRLPFWPAAPEFTAIGNKAGALNLLHEVLSQRKVRTWAKSYETIMMRYIELCVDLKDHHRGKDGLHQYRNLSQVKALAFGPVVFSSPTPASRGAARPTLAYRFFFKKSHGNLHAFCRLSRHALSCASLCHSLLLSQAQAPGSLEAVIVHFLNSAEAKLTEAASTAEAAVEEAEAVADLETGGSPESLMMSTMTEEGGRQRSERKLLVPWLVFVWETYRAVLDILRSSSKLEVCAWVCGARSSLVLAHPSPLTQSQLFLTPHLLASATAPMRTLPCAASLPLFGRINPCVFFVFSKGGVPQNRPPRV